MDDMWRLKFSSMWTLPMPEILPSPLTPAIVPMNTTNQQYTFPFATQEYNVENHATSQESPFFPTLHLGVTDSGKKELTNSFLATTPHNLPDGISPLVKLHGHNSDRGGTIVSNSCYAPQITNIYPLNKSTNDSILNPRIHLLDESKLSLLFKSSKSPNFPSDLKSSTPNDRVVNNNQYYPFHSQMNTIRTSQTVTARTAAVYPSHESIHYRGCPRVICMNTVGELFLSELGILGITCYCHNITMSVAKFCKHSGSSANVGHAVHLESGMTIAHWRKLFFRNTAPDDGKGWDWPASSSTENCTVKHRVTLPLHPHTVGHAKTFSGLANSLEREYHTNNIVTAGYDSIPHPNSKSSISRNNISSEEHKVSVNGHSSDIDLRLGQPPQVHSYEASSSTAINSMQCKPEANHPSKEKFLAASAGQNELRNQAMLTEDSSICSKGGHESFTCDACSVNDHPCLRLGKRIYDQEEQCYKKPFCGNCYSVLPKHLTTCCLYKDFISSSSSLNSQRLCGVAKVGHFPQTRNEIHKFHGSKCKNRKQNFTSGLPGLWRDVPAKKIDATPLKSSIGKVDKTAHDSESKMEDQMSNICTGSPAPALTEVSVEVNRETICSRDLYNRKSYEFVVDEKSVIEKCGSSDEAAISECEKTKDVVANQDNNMKSKDEEQMETISWPINSESSHCVGHVNHKLFEHDQHTCPIQVDNLKQSSCLKRKEFSCSLNEISETGNKIQVIKKDQLLETLAVPSEKNKQLSVQETEESNDLDFRKPHKYISFNYIAEDDTNVKTIDKEYIDTKGKPVVCGEYGGLSGQKKPAKIVFLSSILKQTKRIYTNEYGLLYRKTFSSKVKKMSLKNNNEHNVATSNDSKNDAISQNETTCGTNREENSTHHDCKEYKTRPGYKEVRSCSLSKLLATDHHTILGNVSIDVESSGKRYQNTDVHDGEPIQIGTESRSGEMNFDASCCVCGRANREETSAMLECGRCLIKVHQACYGVSEVPLGNWHCRPCKINSQNTGLLQSDTVKNPKPKCSRTEGFNDMKSEEASNHSFSKTAYNGGKRCIVSQEQINAWAYINSLTSCRKAPLKWSSTDTDYDTRASYKSNRYSKKLDASSIHLNQTQKEYLRYKQSKAWKNLVVYKSGIHSFGLYSSELINRGTMVVEYVGEIIGQKVADKREKEYEVSNGLQYKSACYFFRIDKDNIIDATRKGGIARFVNHSCQPNCVARIITVRGQKKVVFFATRDINPGEEITYDYHFNSEDEGEKIPCYCNSKNCRRYLN